MSIINGHTTRAIGTVLTAAIYNADHLNHVSNASTLNTDKMEGTPPPVVDGHAVVWNGVGGNVLRTASFFPVNKAGDTFTGMVGIANSAPLFKFDETDQASAEGLWRIAVDGGQWQVRHNISISRDFVPETTPFGISSQDVVVFLVAPQRGSFILWDDDNYDNRVAAMSGGGTTNFLRADGTWAAPPLPPAGSITLSTEQATTSGTSKDFTGIPAGVKRITVMFNGVSYTATNKTTMIQLGDAGGIEATGYGPLGLTTAFSVAQNPAAADVYSAAVSLNLFSASSNLWICDPGSAAYVQQTKTLSGTLDRVRITSDGTFDAGAVNISYES